MRLATDQVAKYIILIPYYEDLCRMSNGSFKQQVLPTQAAKWASNMMTSFSPENIRTIKLDSSLILRNGIEL